ncbi:MAG TPA: toprim domain-containing protein, partial [Acidimicrobiales bacterium]|nr:toprim domain-containing protein [Acidimicrobiales bacterium]
RDVGPKYKNSPEGPIYSKRRTLYGLNWAKHAIIERGEVVVCEGYTDVIAFFQADLPCAVATCGTALGEEHFRLLRNFAKRVVLAYDADAAGQSGANRVYEWERHHEVDVAVAALPSGADPADLVRSDPGQLRAAVVDARPFLRFRVERVLAAADLRSAEGRAKAAESALAAVAEHPNELVRDQYLMMVADRCRLDAPALRPLLERLVHDVRNGTLASPGRRIGVRPAGGSPGDTREGGGHVRPTDISDASAGETAEASRRRLGRDGATRSGLEALRLTVHARSTVVDRFDPVLFSDPVQRAAFEALARCEDLHQAVDFAERQDPEVARLLRRVAVEEPAGDADDVVMLLVRNATRRALADIEQRGRVAPENLGELASVAAAVRCDLEELDDPERALAASDRLLAWLIGMRSDDE